MRTTQLYVDYTLPLNEIFSKKGLRKAKAVILKQLQHDRKIGKHLKTVERYCFKLPLNTRHEAHPVGEAGSIGHSIHPEITRKIRELVGENITSPDVVRKCLEQYVEKEMFRGNAAQQKPIKSNRRYYPSRQDLGSHIARAITASKYCSDDQESLKRKVDQWFRETPTSKFYIRTRDDDNTDGNESKFMFIHQAEWQQRLLLRYGSELVLMDANTNRIEAQSKVFKYSYLPSSLDKSVFGIVVMIVESFVPDSYQHYLDTNPQVSSSY